MYLPTQPYQQLFHVLRAIVEIPESEISKLSTIFHPVKLTAGEHFIKAIRWQLEPTSVKVFEIIAPLVDTPMTQGRGKGKIQPDALVEEFWRNFSHDHYEMLIGKSKLLSFHTYPLISDHQTLTP